MNLLKRLKDAYEGGSEKVKLKRDIQSLAFPLMFETVDSRNTYFRRLYEEYKQRLGQIKRPANTLERMAFACGREKSLIKLVLGTTLLTTIAFMSHDYVVNGINHYLEEEREVELMQDSTFLEELDKMNREFYGQPYFQEGR